jgi:DNA-binding MarR family transcriptional regulator
MRPPKGFGPTPPDDVRDRYLDALPDGTRQPVELLFALRACMQRVNADLSHWLGEEALSPGRMQLLVTLWARKQPLSQRDLVAALKVSRASISELVEALLRDGHIRTHADQTDRRVVLVELTKAGRRLAERQIHDNAERLRKSFGSLSAAEQTSLVQLLARLCPAV